MNQKIDFESVEQKLLVAIGSSNYDVLIEKIRCHKKIFIFGNGGLLFIGSHAATDFTRLVKGKVATCFDNAGFITSNANDYGWTTMFIRWLETVVLDNEPQEDVLLIGLSCSGNSENVLNALCWGKENGFATFFIRGAHSKNLPDDIDSLTFNCKSFHTTEILTLMLFYDIIHQLDSQCPSIETENIRKGVKS